MGGQLKLFIWIIRGRILSENENLSQIAIFELSDCTLRIFRGYDFSVFLLFLDRYFEVFDSDLRASLPRMFNHGVPPLGSVRPLWIHGK